MRFSISKIKLEILVKYGRRDTKMIRFRSVKWLHMYFDFNILSNSGFTCTYQISAQYSVKNDYSIQTTRQTQRFLFCYKISKIIKWKWWGFWWVLFYFDSTFYPTQNHFVKGSLPMLLAEDRKVIRIPHYYNFLPISNTKDFRGN